MVLLICTSFSALSEIAFEDEPARRAITGHPTIHVASYEYPGFIRHVDNSIYPTSMLNALVSAVLTFALSNNSAQNPYLMTVSWTPFRRYNLCTIPVYLSIGAETLEQLAVVVRQGFMACRAEQRAVSVTTFHSRRGW